MAATRFRVEPDPTTALEALSNEPGYRPVVDGITIPVISIRMRAHARAARQSGQTARSQEREDEHATLFPARRQPLRHWRGRHPPGRRDYGDRSRQCGGLYLKRMLRAGARAFRQALAEYR